MSHDRNTDGSDGLSPATRPGYPSTMWRAGVAGVLFLAVISAVVYANRDSGDVTTRTAASKPSTTTTLPASTTSTTAATTTSSAPPTTSTTVDTSVPLSSVNWASLSYPVDCGGQTVGTAAAYPTPEPGRELAVVFVTCVAGAGAPPSAVLIYDGAESPTSAHLSQTLLRYQDYWAPEEGGTVANERQLAVNVYGYSSGDIPRCCPDLNPQLTWEWVDGEYVATIPQPEHLRLPDR
jgi:hypothetical protein